MCRSGSFVRPLERYRDAMAIMSLAATATPIIAHPGRLNDRTCLACAKFNKAYVAAEGIPK